MFRCIDLLEKKNSNKNQLHDQHVAPTSRLEGIGQVDSHSIDRDDICGVILKKRMKVQYASEHNHAEPQKKQGV